MSSWGDAIVLLSVFRGTTKGVTGRSTGLSMHVGQRFVSPSCLFIVIFLTFLSCEKIIIKCFIFHSFLFTIRYFLYI